MTKSVPSSANSISYKEHESHVEIVNLSKVFPISRPSLCGLAANPSAVGPCPEAAEGGSDSHLCARAGLPRKAAHGLSFWGAPLSYPRSRRGNRLHQDS